MSGSDGSRETPGIQTTKAHNDSFDIETNAFNFALELGGLRRDVNAL